MNILKYNIKNSIASSVPIPVALVLGITLQWGSMDLIDFENQKIKNYIPNASNKIIIKLLAKYSL